MLSLKCIIPISTFIISYLAFIAGDKVMLCYVVGWAQRRPAQGKFTVLDADTEHCTHIVYAFMGLNESTNAAKYADSIIDVDTNGKRQYQLSKLKRLKIKNTKLKILASIGGYAEGGKKFSDMARAPEKRKIFIKNIKAVIKDYSLDGLDFCWQFPGQRGGRPEDKRNSLTLFKELKEAFRPEGWLLTVHILGLRQVIDSYDIKALSGIVDFINLAAYEYNKPSDGVTGILAPLRSDDQNNVESSLDYMLKKGANPKKVLLGLPLYGHAYISENLPRWDNYKGLESKQMFASPRTQQNGLISYAEMCYNLNSTEGWTEIWDQESQTPVALNGNKFVSFENKRSLLLKAELVHTKSLAGVMIWSLDLDDFHGLCQEIKFPLVTAVSDFINIRASGSTLAPKPDIKPLRVNSKPFIEDSYENDSAQDKVILCYMVSWAAFRQGYGYFSVSDAENEYCTHIVYAFTHLDNSTNRITLSHPENRNELLKFKNLKESNRNLKLLASIGGYGQGSRRFSDMSLSEQSRKIFIESLVNFINLYELDGIDVCWQFPGLRDGRPVDKDTSIQLFKEIKSAFKPKGYILTAHVLGHRYVVDAYHIQRLSEIVDYINFAAVEYHGGWETTTGISTPLTSSDEANVKSNLDYILSKGVSPKKLLLGLPTFGHAYAFPESPRGKFVGVYYDHLVSSQWTNEPGLIGYNELCYEVSFPAKFSWTELWEDLSQTPIAYSGNTFVTYENARSLHLKAQLAVQKNLAGVMIWSLDMDDFRGLCIQSGGKKYPLLSKVAETIKRRRQAILTSTSSPNSTSSNNGCINITKGPHSIIASCEYGKK